MILVRVELWSAVTGEKTTLALMSICNSGRGTRTRGDYAAKTFRGRDEATLAAALRDDTTSRNGLVKNHARLQEHVWNLVAKALVAMHYGAAS